jgi:hypothetical protein
VRTLQLAKVFPFVDANLLVRPAKAGPSGLAEDLRKR